MTIDPDRVYIHTIVDFRETKDLKAWFEKNDLDYEVARVFTDTIDDKDRQVVVLSVEECPLHDVLADRINDAFDARLNTRVLHEMLHGVLYLDHAGIE
jgi:hypothetical protein